MGGGYIFSFRFTRLVRLATLLFVFNIITACPAWVRSSLGASSPELRRVKQHIERGGVILLHNDVDYVRVIQRGGQQPSKTTNGLIPNATVDPPMSHQSGIRIGLSGQVFLPRKLNASTPHASMPKYLLVGPQLNWLAVIPPEDVSRTSNAIDLTRPVLVRPAIIAPVEIDPNVPGVADGPILDDAAANPIGGRIRNSLLAMGSSFMTASFQIDRNRIGSKSTFFLAGAGMLAATEYSETPVISQGTV